WSSVTLCASCDEFTDKTCKRNPGSCVARYPDFACQTKEIYALRYTGEYVFRYAILGCPKRCAEYTRVTNWDKTVFSCCHEGYCNSKSPVNLTPSKSSY
ncbi:hypothetical protein J0S82_007939, partial [Galemys pyrenaicus]